jgi:hypothetical protein
LNQRKRIALLFTACIIAISLINLFIKEACNIKVQASSFLLDNKNQKVVVIIADYFELQDFARNDYLSQLFNKSYSALVSGRQNGKASLAKAKLAIGSSQRLEISSGMMEAENYAADFERLTNDKVLGDYGNVIYKNISNLKRLNKNDSSSLYIGYLGEKLNEINMTTCLIGNSDTSLMNRSSVLLAMDEKGIVDMGDVENTLLYDNRFPGGKKTDFSKLLELYKNYSSKSDLIVIDTGDLARLEFYKNQLSSEEFEAQKKAIVDNIAGFTNDILQGSRENTTFMILSAYPSQSNVKAGFKLTTLAVYNSSEGGVLFSNSTKRTGIITSLDIADYILEKLTGEHVSKLREIPVNNSMQNMLSLKRKLLSVSKMRLPVLTWYAIFEIVCAIGGFLYLINDNRNILCNLVKITMLANIVAPAIMLYMSIFEIETAAIYFTVLIIISYIVAALLFYTIKTFVGQFLGAALFVNINIVIDLFRDSALIKNSIFGYDPIIGARFYGIGNEYAGVFIGCGILLAGCLLQVFKKYAMKKPKTTTVLLIIYTSFQLLMMGMPFAGANFGGTIAGVFGYYFFFSTVKKVKIRLSQLLILALILIIALSSIIALDLINSENTTHVGKFITDIKENGLKVLMSTLSRKVSMNLRLIKYTIWTKVLLCIILIITIMFFKPVRLLHDIFKKYNYFAAAWIGISAGSIAGLIANDSGIVMAATAMIFTGYTILYICLQEKSEAK